MVQREQYDITEVSDFSEIEKKEGKVVEIPEKKFVPKKIFLRNNTWRFKEVLLLSYNNQHDEAYKLLMKDENKDTDWYLCLADLYYIKGDLIEAKKNIEIAREVEPHNDNIKKAYKMVKHLIKNEEYEEKIFHEKFLEKFDENDEDDWLKRRIIKWNKDDFESF